MDIPLSTIKSICVIKKTCWAHRTEKTWIELIAVPAWNTGVNTYAWLCTNLLEMEFCCYADIQPLLYISELSETISGIISDKLNLFKSFSSEAQVLFSLHRLKHFDDFTAGCVRVDLVVCMNRNISAFII